MKTYNKYLTEGISDGSIKSKTIDGCTTYLVRRPKDGEPVDGYFPLSSPMGDLTPTDLAALDARLDDGSDWGDPDIDGDNSYR